MELKAIQSLIYEVRGQKIMLDFDLAELYEVETRALNQAVKRNIDFFPADFMFQLKQKEWETMSSQFVMTYPLLSTFFFRKTNLKQNRKTGNELDSI